MVSEGEWRRPVRIAAVAGCVLALAGCESVRFGGLGPAAAPRAAVTAPAPDPIVSAVPSGSVTSEPLAPPPGSAPVARTEVPVLSGAPSQIETLGASAGSGGGQAPPVASRSATVGGWTAREAAGTSCRINLSSTPSLDLYRANASGCSNKDLARITAWDFRDGEVYLYQPGGAVAARLRPSTGSLSGVLSKSGAPLTLSRG